MARRHGNSEETNIDLTPMLDVTFIMLIFFIVTTSFVKEAGLEVDRPNARMAQEQAASILVAVSGTGQIWMNKHPVELDSVRSLTEVARADNPEGSAMVIADRSAPSGVVIQVMDQIRLAGVTKITIAAQHATE